MPTLKEYARQELARIEEKRQAAITAQGGHPFLGPIPEGTSELRLLPEIPKEGKYGKLFTVQKPGNDEVYSWTIRDTSPLYREVLEALPEAPCALQIVRIGQDKTDTRYSVTRIGRK